MSAATIVSAAHDSYDVSWATFAGVAGGAAAGLIGLTFIVTAIRFDTIAVSTELRNRVGQALAVFVTVLLVAVAIAIPQRVEALGVELLALAVASAAALKALDARARPAQSSPPSVTLLLATGSFVAALAAAGVLLVIDVAWGRYLYAAGSAIGLAWAVYAAWTFLTRAERNTTA